MMSVDTYVKRNGTTNFWVDSKEFNNGSRKIPIIENYEVDLCYRQVIESNHVRNIQHDQMTGLILE